MNLNRIGRAALFLSGSVIGGLALAFVVVFLRPQLLLRPAGLVPAPTNLVVPPYSYRNATTLVIGSENGTTQEAG